MTENVPVADNAGPSLFEECMSMWAASVATPASTNLRILAREGKLSQEDADKVLELPISFHKNIQVFLKNKELLLKEFADDAGIPFHIQVFESLDQHISLDSQKIVIFGDEHRDSELVYGIGINHDKKRITLTFRGSVTPKDYKVDFTLHMQRYPNPVPGQSKAIAVHSGFSNYLLEKEKGGMRKLDVITEHLSTLFQQHPDYSLYSTGHSLGGSLALLAAFELAASHSSNNTIPTPITLVTFGPMLVGDLRFRRAFQALEQEGKIRCVNVVNDGDFIPLIPPRGGCFRAYQIAGTQLVLFSKDKKKHPVHWSGPPKSRWYWQAALRNIPNQVVQDLCMLWTLFCVKNFWVHHSVLEYMGSLTGSKEELQKMTLDGICGCGHSTNLAERKTS